MTDEMDRTSDDRWLPESDADGTGISEGNFPSFEEALRAHGFEVEPPRLAADPGELGCAPPPLPDDDLIALPEPANDHRLEDPGLAKRSREIS